MTKKITAETTDAKFVTADSEMLAAEAKYREFEKSLERRVAAIQQDFPGYHSYTFDIAPIEHDPYVLISILSAVKPDFKLSDPEIVELFQTMEQPRRQYTLTISKSIATRYTDKFDDTVDFDTIDPQYMSLNVKLTNYDLYCIVDSILTHDQLAAYAGYYRNHGGRPDLFPRDEYPFATELEPPMDYRVPVDRLQQYPPLAKMLAIAEPLIGYPYVWGGSDTETGFDCSGFVDYVMDQTGYHYRNFIHCVERRLPVAGSTIGGKFYDGIYEKCQPVKIGDQRPGDLVFFRGTFDASYRSVNLTHVGIYVGDNVFLACSAPLGIRYQTYEMCDEKGRPWKTLLYGYGRLADKGDKHE